MSQKPRYKKLFSDISAPSGALLLQPVGVAKSRTLEYSPIDDRFRVVVNDEVKGIFEFAESAIREYNLGGNDV